MQDQLYIPAFWFSSNNFGDNLTHFLIKEMSGKTPVLTEMSDPVLKYMVTGSIMSLPVVNASVWGCGIATRNSRIPTKSYIWAVRGHYTGQRLQELRMPYNEVYGDPALLLPRLYNPSIDKKYRLGILPHYVDTADIYNRLGLTDQQLEDQGVKILDVLTDVRSFVDQINSCEKIISSTLHGIITSHTYGIPCKWAMFSNKLGGDGVKFLDYYSSIKPPGFSYEAVDSIKPLDFRGEISLTELIAINIEPTRLNIDLDALWQACPFKK